VDVSREAIVAGENARYGPGFETKCIDGTSDEARIAAGIEPSISELLRATGTGLGLPNLFFIVRRQVVFKLEAYLPLLLSATAASRAGRFRLLRGSFRWRYIRQ
jgi:hypothetical protein